MTLRPSATNDSSRKLCSDVRADGWMRGGKWGGKRSLVCLAVLLHPGERELQPLRIQVAPHDVGASIDSREAVPTPATARVEKPVA